MTDILKLTEKEWLILKLFIIQESIEIENSRLKNIREQEKIVPQKLVLNHFYSYPNEIVTLLTTQKEVNQEEMDSYKSGFHRAYVKDIHLVTVPTAVKACRKFADNGIFEQVEDKWTRNEVNPQKTTQYFLKSDSKSFRTIFAIIWQHCDPYEIVEMLGFQYFRDIINEDLVRKKLLERGINVKDNPDIFDWNLEEGLILPLLALIQSSPTALYEFVLGKWESYELLYGLIHKKDEKFSNPLFLRLIGLALSDISRTLSIPGNNNVESFEVRGFYNQLNIDGNYCPENALLRIGLTRGYGIYYDMGYSTSKRKYPQRWSIEEVTTLPRPYDFWVQIRVKQESPFFLRKPEIHITTLLTSLKAQSRISNHVRGFLSNRMQNKILRFKNVNAPTPVFSTSLIEELNRALLREDFYHVNAFSEVNISPESRDLLEKYAWAVKYDDRSTGAHHRIKLHRNRRLLEDAFPEAITRYGDVQYSIR